MNLNEIFICTPIWPVSATSHRYGAFSVTITSVVTLMFANLTNDPSVQCALEIKGNYIFSHVRFRTVQVSGLQDSHLRPSNRPSVMRTFLME